MAKLNLVVGSMLGAAEYVADHVASLLEQAGHQTRIHNPASLAEVLAEPDAILLVITSTHGAGDVPDNLQPFAKDLADQHPDLNALKYGVIGLGTAVMTPSVRVARRWIDRWPSAAPAGSGIVWR